MDVPSSGWGSHFQQNLPFLVALTDKHPMRNNTQGHAYMLIFKSNIWLLQEDVDMTEPAGHLQMELCSPNRKMCRQHNLVPAFIKFSSSHPHSSDDFLPPFQRRGEWRELLPLTMRDQCFMNPLQKQAQQKLTVQGRKEEKKAHIPLFLGSFPFLSAQQNCALG